MSSDRRRRIFLEKYVFSQIHALGPCMARTLVTGYDEGNGDIKSKHTQ